MTIDYLGDKKIPVEVGMVIKRDNIHLIPDMAKLLEVHNVNNLRLIPFIPIGHGKNLKNNFFVKYGEIINFSDEKIGGVRLSSDIGKLSKHNPTYGCGAGITTVNVNMDMTLSPCDLLTDKVKSEPFGDYESFLNVWRNDMIFNGWRFGEIYDAMTCGKCSLFLKCGGYDG